jgi:ABC-type sulfate transport system permease component
MWDGHSCPSLLILLLFLISFSLLLLFLPLILLLSRAQSSAAFLRALRESSAISAVKGFSKAKPDSPRTPIDKP